jgi:hypothetical protein
MSTACLWRNWYGASLTATSLISNNFIQISIIKSDSVRRLTFINVS